MRDARTQKLAHLIVHHSTRLQPGEAVLVEAFDLADGLVLDLVEEIQKAGGIPIVSLREQRGHPRPAARRHRGRSSPCSPTSSCTR